MHQRRPACETGPFCGILGVMPADTELDVDAFADALAGDEEGRKLLVLDALQECDRRGPLPEPLLEPLLGCLGHRRKAVQRTAAEVLAQWSRITPDIRSRLLGRLGAPEPHERWGAAFALAKIGPEPATLEVLLETLGQADGDMRWAAQTIVVDLARRDPPIAAALVRLAGAGSAEQRKMAMYCLRDLGAPQPGLREVLASALAHASSDVRLAALSSLAALYAEDGETVEPILDLARDDAEPGVRRAAVSTLGKLRPPAVWRERIARALDTAAGSGDASLRRAALGARRKLGEDEP